jgi:hypothetical protein
MDFWFVDNIAGEDERICRVPASVPTTPCVDGGFCKISGALDASDKSIHAPKMEAAAAPRVFKVPHESALMCDDVASLVKYVVANEAAAQARLLHHTTVEVSVNGCSLLPKGTATEHLEEVSISSADERQLIGGTSAIRAHVLRTKSNHARRNRVRRLYLRNGVWKQVSLSSSCSIATRRGAAASAAGTCQ